VSDAPDTQPLPLRWALAVAAAAGLVLWAAFPRLSWWPLAPVALAALALATRGQRPRRAALLGFGFGLAFLVPHLHWSGVYVGLLPWAALSSLEAGYLAAMSALLPAAWRAPFGRAGTVLTVSGLWVAQEALRDRTPFGGFPWARIAFSQTDGPLLRFAALGGAPLVTGVTAAVGGCLAVAIAVLLDRRIRAAGSASPTPATAGRGLVRAGAGLAAAVLLGAVGAAIPAPTGADRFAQVAAVQGNVPKAGLDFNAQRRAVLDNHAGATWWLARDVTAGRAPQPDVVLWPENSSDIDPLRNGDAYTEISQVTDAVKVPVLIGAVLEQPYPKISNAGILWLPGSGPGPQYLKRHPAPFAEYIPFRSFFRHFSDKVDLVSRDFAAGQQVGVLPAGPTRLGDIICFEVAYDDLVRDTVTAGADLLVVQTNNATFGYTDESVQQLAMSRLRAVETGRAVVHISTVGVSALIMPDGRTVQRSGHYTQQVLTGRLPLRTEQTVATRLGVLPELALAAVGLLLAVVGGRAGRRSGAGRGGRAWRTARTPRTSRDDTTGAAQIGTIDAAPATSPADQRASDPSIPRQTLGGVGQEPLR
jgi:apolipoprotein N-acyltransferase